MVNPLIFPVQRRGPSGPQGSSGGSGSSDFEPSDNRLYFDPEYVDGAENGSIAGPYTSWLQWVAGATAGEYSWKVHFPGYSVAAGVSFQISPNHSLILEGVGKKDSIITGIVEMDDSENSVISYQRLNIESILLNGGNYELGFEHSEVGDIDDSGDLFDGTLYGFYTDFAGTVDLGDCLATIVGGAVSDLTASTITLTDCIVGSLDQGSAGDITAESTFIRCRGVTFVPGSTITFSGSAGELYLDPASYRSFLDGNITLTNGHVTRDDGSWPRDAAVYESGDVIDFYQNPRAILISDEGYTIDFVPPLTRECQLLVVNDGTGGHTLDWAAPIRWTDGIAPDQDTTPNSIALYRFDWEEDLGYYIGWMVTSDAKEES